MNEPTTHTADSEAAHMPYRYFVSYSHGAGYGSIQISSSLPADNMQTIDAFRGTISTVAGIPLHRIVILNYVPLGGPDTAQHQPGAAEQALRDLLRMVDQFDTPRDPGRVQAFVGDVRQVALRGLGHHRG